MIYVSYHPKLVDNDTWRSDSAIENSEPPPYLTRLNPFFKDNFSKISSLFIMREVFSIFLSDQI